MGIAFNSTVYMAEPYCLFTHNALLGFENVHGSVKGPCAIVCAHALYTDKCLEYVYGRLYSLAMKDGRLRHILSLEFGPIV